MGRLALDRPAAELLDDPDLNRLFLGGVAQGGRALPRIDPRERSHHAGQDHRHQGPEARRRDAARSARRSSAARASACSTEAATVARRTPDVIEWRVDYFDAIGDTAAVLDTGRALRAAVGDTPIIFTRRSIKEGGEPIAIDDEGVVRLYDAVGASGLVDFIDFEMGNDAEHVRARARDARGHGDAAHPLVPQLRLHAGRTISSSSAFSKPSDWARTSRRSR